MLSSSKKKFIETWQKEVSQYMKEGNICRVVVAPVTPENGDDAEISKNESRLKALFEKPETFNGTRLTKKQDPRERLPYVNAYDKRQNVEKVQSDYTTLETNGRKSNGNRRQHSGHSGDKRSNYKYSLGEPVILDDHFNRKASTLSEENKKYKRKSTKIAKEIYEKYTSIDPNYMHTQMNRHRTPPRLLSQISWRTKTFLELPFRIANNSSHFTGIDPLRSGIPIGLHRTKSLRRMESVTDDSNDEKIEYREHRLFD